MDIPFPSRTNVLSLCVMLSQSVSHAELPQAAADCTVEKGGGRLASKESGNTVWHRQGHPAV